MLDRFNSALSQAVCAIFEKSVKTLLHDFAPMVSQLSEMLGQMYSTIPQASALDLTRQVHETQDDKFMFIQDVMSMWVLKKFKFEVITVLITKVLIIMSSHIYLFNTNCFKAASS